MNKINNYNKEEHIQFIETLIKTEQVAVFINNMDISEQSKVEQNDTLEYLYNRIIVLQNNWKELKEENKALLTLVEWFIECGMGFDNIASPDDMNWEEFEEESKNMGYTESLIYYAKKYNQLQELEQGKDE